MFEIILFQWMKKYFKEVGFEICTKICRSMSGKEFIRRSVERSKKTRRHYDINVRIKKKIMQNGDYIL